MKGGGRSGGKWGWVRGGAGAVFLKRGLRKFIVGEEGEVVEEKEVKEDGDVGEKEEEGEVEKLKELVDDENEGLGEGVVESKIEGKVEKRDIKKGRDCCKVGEEEMKAVEEGSGEREVGELEKLEELADDEDEELEEGEVESKVEKGGINEEKDCCKSEDLGRREDDRDTDSLAEEGEIEIKEDEESTGIGISKDFCHEDRKVGRRKEKSGGARLEGERTKPSILSDPSVKRTRKVDQDISVLGQEKSVSEKLRTVVKQHDFQQQKNVGNTKIPESSAKASGRDLKELARPLIRSIKGPPKRKRELKETAPLSSSEKKQRFSTTPIVAKGQQYLQNGSLSGKESSYSKRVTLKRTVLRRSQTKKSVPESSNSQTYGSQDPFFKESQISRLESKPRVVGQKRVRFKTPDSEEVSQMDSKCDRKGSFGVPNGTVKRKNKAVQLRSIKCDFNVKSIRQNIENPPLETETGGNDVRVKSTGRERTFEREFEKTTCTLGKETNTAPLAGNDKQNSSSASILSENRGDSPDTCPAGTIGVISTKVESTKSRPRDSRTKIPAPESFISRKDGPQGPAKGCLISTKVSRSHIVCGKRPRASIPDTDDVPLSQWKSDSKYNEVGKSVPAQLKTLVFGSDAGDLRGENEERPIGTLAIRTIKRKRSALPMIAEEQVEKAREVPKTSYQESSKPPVVHQKKPEEKINSHGSEGEGHNYVKRSFDQCDVSTSVTVGNLKPGRIQALRPDQAQELASFFNGDEFSKDVHRSTPACKRPRLSEDSLNDNNRKGAAIETKSKLRTVCSATTSVSTDDERPSGSWVTSLMGRAEMRCTALRKALERVVHDAPKTPFSYSTTHRTERQLLLRDFNTAARNVYAQVARQCKKLPGWRRTRLQSTSTGLSQYITLESGLVNAEDLLNQTVDVFQRRCNELLKRQMFESNCARRVELMATGRF